MACYDPNNKRTDDNGDAGDKINSVDAAKQHEKAKSHKTKKRDEQSIDEMKITDLKTALKRLNLSTTGGKIELKKRLQDAREKQQSLQEVQSDNVDDEDDDTASEESSTNDGALDDENMSDGEGSKKRKEQDDRELKLIDRMSRCDESEGAAERRLRRRATAAQRRDADIIGKRRVRTKKERALSDPEETSDTSESSDSDYSLERNHHRGQHRHSKFTIKDVEGSLTYFSGDDKLPIEKWISEFEDMSALLRWDDLQKLIYGKRMLTGLAKQFISCEKRITSWNTLKH